MANRKYLYQHKDGGGREKNGYVEAASVAEAHEKLAALGVAGYTLLDDDFSAESRRAAEDEGIVPDKDVDVFARYDASALGAARIALRKNLFLVGGGIVLGGYMLASGSVGFGAAVLATVAAILAFPAWVQHQQNQLYISFWRRDYDASERIARRFLRLPMFGKVKPIRLEMEGRVAAAMIRRGERDAAFALMAPWLADAGLPRAMVLTKVANLHFLAREWDTYVAMQEEILAAGNGADVAKIDLAQTLARMGDDDVRARELLASVDTRAMSPLHHGFVEFGWGVLELRAGNDEAAVGKLQRAAAHMEAMAANPIAWGALAVCLGYLAVALARTGQRAAAEKVMAMCGGIVAVHGEDRLQGWLRDEGLTRSDR